MEATIWIVALAFAGMGVMGIVKPQAIMDYFGVQLTVDGRNEVRAVYGGFGLAYAAALVYSLQNTRFSAGIIVFAAVALAGMATGRAISLAFEKPGKWPLVFMILEAAGATALYLAIPKGAGFNLGF